MSLSTGRAGWSLASLLADDLTSLGHILMAVGVFGIVVKAVEVTVVLWLLTGTRTQPGGADDTVSWSRVVPPTLSREAGAMGINCVVVMLQL